MKKKIIISMLAMLFIAGPVAACCYTNKDVHNNTGQPAWDIRIVLAGVHKVVWHYKGYPNDYRFRQFRSWVSGGNTVMRWWDPVDPYGIPGPIPFCKYVHIGYELADPVTGIPGPAKVIFACWTDRRGKCICCSRIPQPSHDVFYPDWPNRLVNLELSNNLIDICRPIVVRNLSYVVLPEEMPLDLLNDRNQELMGMLQPVTGLPTDGIPRDESMQVTIPEPLDPGQFLVYRFEVEDPCFPEQPMIDFGQHGMMEPPVVCDRDIRSDLDGDCYVRLPDLNIMALEWLDCSYPGDPDCTLVPLEACCLPNGNCAYVTAAQCLARGGAPQGVGTRCNEFLCPQPPQACCLGDGTCMMAPPEQCLGTPMGPGSDCLTARCVPSLSQACCLPDGQCVDVPALMCEIEYGGVPQGPDTDCANTACPQPLQACCMSDGQCIEATEAECIELGGMPQGIGTDCTNTRCPVACCLEGGECIDVPPIECYEQYQGRPIQGATCEMDPCPQACCRPDGLCMDVPPPLCIQLYQGTPMGPGTDCFNTTCPEPTEACCQPDGTCVDVPPALCDGMPMGPGSDCSNTTCPQPEACCLEDGTCVDVPPEECDLEYQGTPQGPGTNCQTTNCPEPTEACCQPDGTCIDVPANQCDGLAMGPGTDCANVYCPEECVCVGDLNRDGVINTQDESMLTAMLAMLPPPPEIHPDDPMWDSCADIDGNGVINTSDLTALTAMLYAAPGYIIYCPQACCLQDGSCVDVAPLECQNAYGGIPQGVGTDCLNTDCVPEETVACCMYYEGGCQDLPMPVCLDLGGNPQPAGSNCLSDPCPQDCCVDSATGECYSGVSPEQCDMQYGGTMVHDCSVDCYGGTDMMCCHDYCGSGQLMCEGPMPQGLCETEYCGNTVNDCETECFGGGDMLCCHDYCGAGQLMCEGPMPQDLCEIEYCGYTVNDCATECYGGSDMMCCVFDPVMGMDCIGPMPQDECQMMHGGNPVNSCIECLY